MTRRFVPLLALTLFAGACGAGTNTGESVDASSTAVGSSSTVTAITTTSTSTTVAPTTTTRPSSSTTSTTTRDSATTTTTSSSAGQTAIVVEVTDGDTIRIQINGTEDRLRLIGINAPEGGECIAEEATARLTDLVLGETVTLTSDTSDRDQFDRLLRYVYLGDMFVNEMLVREGLAIARRYEPDTAQAEVLEAAQRAAGADRVGMWALDACGTAAAGEIAIGAIRYDADGNDNQNLNDEWVEFTNPGSGAVDLTGWQIKDESASHRYSFPSAFTLNAGTTVRLHTGCGTDTPTALYWCNTGSAVWNNGGDTVFVLDPAGNIVASESY